MDKSRNDIKREYKERPKQAGVFQIKNTMNGKVFLGSSLNLEGALNRHKFMLKIGKHDVEQIQQDWNALGPAAFIFEVLEVVNVPENSQTTIEDELTLLEQIWIEKLQPFGEHGYNKNTRIRQA